MKKISPNENTPSLSLSLRSYDSAVIQLLREIKAGFDKLDEILGQIQVIPVAHGGTTRQVSAPTILDTQMKEMSVQFTIDLELFRKTDVDGFAEYLWGLCQEFITQATKHMFETVAKTSDAVGNTLNVEGRNIWDAMNDIMEKTEMRFDESGNHNNKFYLHPDNARKLAENPCTPEQQKRRDAIISAKREEYYAQKRTRRLS